MAAVQGLPAVVSRDEWFKARKDLLVEEKEHTRAGDQINTKRQELPMVLVDKEYTFEDANGTKARLIDLFDGQPQLIVHHVMFSKDWDEMCPGCAGMCDSLGRHRMLRATNTAVVVVSRAPSAKPAGIQKRMSWTFPWYSSHDSDFNDDFMAVLASIGGRGDRGDIPRASVFLRQGDTVYHTYTTTGRGVEKFISDFGYLDISPLGQQEKWERPEGRTEAADLTYQSEVRFPDELGISA